MDIDEFALADTENDEKKCEDYARDGSNSAINTSNLKDNETYVTNCEICNNTFEYDEMDLFDGEWLCYQCEEEKNEK